MFQVFVLRKQKGDSDNKKYKKEIGAKKKLKFGSTKEIFLEVKIKCFEYFKSVITMKMKI